jgi:hypothetical protein
MVYPRAAVSRRRSLIKYKAGTTPPSLHAPLEDVFTLPQAEDILLKLWKIHLTTNRMKHKNLYTKIKKPAL